MHDEQNDPIPSPESETTEPSDQASQASQASQATQATQATQASAKVIEDAASAVSAYARLSDQESAAPGGAAEPSAEEIAPNPPNAADVAADVVADVVADAAADGPAIAKLTSANMPADRGITSLALLMQLGGTIGIVFAALFALSMALSGAGQITGPLFLVAVLSGIRSAFHRTAGTTLLYGQGSEPLRSVMTYVWISFGQTALCLFILKGYMDTESLVKFGTLFLGWPAAVFVFFARSEIKTLIKDGVPQAEDYGFEGAAVMMTLFGIIGTLFSVYILKILLDDTDVAFATPASGIVVLMFVALAARSIIHALAGFKGISGADFEECNASASRYYNFGIISSICIGVTLFVVVLMTAQSIGAAMIMGGIITPLLLAWPQILKRLYSERNFHVFLAGSEAHTFQRAPDAGLIALGWILVALGVVGLGFALAGALLAEPLTAEELWVIAQSTGQGGLEHATRSAWWSVGVSALELWAGIELVRMSKRHKIAAMIYGVVSIGVVIYLVWPAIDSLGGLFGALMDSSALAQQLLFLATSFPLILAIGTIVLVNRVTVPSAVVHTSKGAKPGVDTAV